MSERQLFSVVKGERQLAPALHSDSGEIVLTAKRLALCSSAQARTMFSFADAQKFKVLPLGLITANEREMVTFAVPNGSARELANALRFVVQREVQLIELAAKTISEAIFIAYHRADNTLKELSKRLVNTRVDNAKQYLQFRGINGDAAVFLESVIDYAIAHEASDLHFLPLLEGLSLRLRVNGEMRVTEHPVCSHAVYREVVSRIKLLAKLDITQHGVVQDGAFSVPICDKDVNLRVSIIPTVHGEKVVLRFIGIQNIPNLKAIGYDSIIESELEHALQLNSGMLIVSGTTGSGKSTTLYSVAKLLIERNLNVATVEDPVEGIISGAAQTSIEPVRGITFSSVLRAILRQDPDVILIGEIRDSETATLAAQAAIAGKLVLASVHAGDTEEVVFRLSALGVHSTLIAQALRLIIWQRLVPKLCQHCKVADLVSSVELTADVYKTSGCSECDYTGIGGRLPIASFMRFNHEFKNTLLEHGLGRKFIELSDAIERNKVLNQTYLSLLKEGVISMHTYNMFKAALRF